MTPVMANTLRFLNLALAVFSGAALIAGQGIADSARAEDLLEELQRPDLPNWQRVEDALWGEWSKSGSAAMDLLLRRGRDAIEAEDYGAAIGHLTALVDHAPDFAEGYNSRALAYYRSGLYGPALADLARTLDLNPRHFGALTGLGTLLEETGQDAAALGAYRAAHAIHPHDPDLEDAVRRLEIVTSGRTL
ncbi:tetratricopeptide repeat protein [Rhodovulum sulfidophilum]|nr:tetratricopeptide repeat protein [Rhodovulum sulfidophilum]